MAHVTTETEIQASVARGADARKIEAVMALADSRGEWSVVDACRKALEGDELYRGVVLAHADMVAAKAKLERSRTHAEILPGVWVPTKRVR